METDGSASHLNPSQALHLLTSARYADKLFADIESVLFASKSKSPFREYKNSFPPAQIKVIEDYLARIRAQLVRMLEAQGIALPEPDIESVHSIRTTLTFAKIAFQDCTPDRMRGYGQIPESKVRELNGIVDEMESTINKLDSYLAQGLGQDLESRLERLAQSGGDVTTVKTIERIINDHGLVEFRSSLSMIIDRLESKNFEIALFGRVSSGKSSLLNSIVQSEILPVGVNPVTAVPTRLVYGLTPLMTVWYANRNPEQLENDKLAEFVTEERNPANLKHVTKIVVELPSLRLQDGVIFVDTPGLGSLSTSGAVETLAYLPRCDLGVVLVDAGSTLSEDDVSTIRALYEAGVPVSVLLSKSDLVTEEDRERVLSYMSQQIAAQLGINLSPYPVSVRASHEALLENWLKREIFPLYERHQQLTQESLQRKIGALREAVETALRSRLKRSARKSTSREIHLAEIESRLRNAVGRFAEARRTCSDLTHDVESFAERGLAMVSSHLVEKWLERDAVSPSAVARDLLGKLAAAQAGHILAALEDLARELTDTLRTTADDLGFKDVCEEDDLTVALKELPSLDLGTLEINLTPSFRFKLSRRLEARRVERRLRGQIGAAVSQAFYNFAKILDSWARRVVSELQLRFDMHADRYRAHLIRLGDGKRLSEAEEVLIQHDLDRLIHAQTGANAERITVS